MNSDIRLSVTFLDNPKIMRLHRRCNAEAVLALLRLWLWASANRPTGTLHGLDADDIEAVARWTGTPGEFVPVLLDLRLLDQEGEFKIHDWTEHNAWQSREIARRERARAAAFAKWEKREARVKQELCGSNAGALLTHDAPNRTEPNQKKKEKPLSPSAPKGFSYVVSWWCWAYERTESRKYVFEGAKDGKVVKDLLSSVPPQDLLARMCNFLLDRSDFVRGKKSLTFFKSQINKYRDQIPEQAESLGLSPPDEMNWSEFKPWEEAERAVL